MQIRHFYIKFEIRSMSEKLNFLMSIPQKKRSFSTYLQDQVWRCVESVFMYYTANLPAVLPDHEVWFRYHPTQPWVFMMKVLFDVGLCKIRARTWSHYFEWKKSFNFLQFSCFLFDFVSHQCIWLLIEIVALAKLSNRFHLANKIDVWHIIDCLLQEIKYKF